MTGEDVKFYGALVGIILGPAGFLIAALTLYLNLPHILRQRRDAITAAKSGDASTTLGDATFRSVPVRPIIFIFMVMAFIVAILSAYTLGSAPKGDRAGPIGPQGAQGERGPRGETGPQGPAGPPGAATLLANDLHSGFKALLKIHVLEKHLRFVDENNARFEAQYQQRLNDSKMPPSAFPFRRGMMEIPIESYLGIIKQNAKNDLGLDIEFGKHPQFDENHFYPAKGEEDIQDQRRQEDYRRINNTYENDRRKIDEVVNRYKNELNQLQSSIERMSN